MNLCIVHEQADSVNGFLFADNLSELLQKLRYARVASSLIAGFDVDELDEVIDELAWRVERNFTPDPGIDPLRGNYTLLVEG